MQNLKFLLSYIFSPNPGNEFSYYLEIGILAGLLLIGGIIFGTIYKKRKKKDIAFKKLFKRVSKFAIYLGLTIGLLTLSRYEQIPYFSMRFLLFVALILTAYLTFRYLRIFFTVYPKTKHNINRNIKIKKTEKYSTKKRRR